jgi:prepilin-type N-terminal cleavage/methylation domain-containing protein
MTAARRHAPHSHDGRGGRGFTLVEAVATMTILSIIAVVASRMVFTASNAFANAAARAELAASASAAMERMTQELRDIGLRPSTTPAEPNLDSVTASSIAWAGDHSLGFSGGSLTLSTGGTARTLAESVSAFTVQAYDQDNAALATSLSGDACDAVRRIQVTLTLTKGGVSETLRTKVFLRCMMAGGGAP